MVKCSNCGSENKKNDKYCSQCGSNLSGIVCSGCGAKIGQGGKFCPVCGSMQSHDFVRRFGLSEIEMNNAVKKSIKNTVEEARFFFKDESEIHGYLRCRLKHNFRESALLKDKEDLILEECKTKLCYQRETGTDKGIPYGSPEYDELRKQGYQPKSAYFDFAIWDPSKEVYDEGREPVPKALIGIEIKRQKEADKKKDFIEAIIRDCKKLTDAGNEIMYKYLLIIMYYPDVFSLDVERDFGSNFGDINVAYCDVNKDAKQIMHQGYIPNEWQIKI